jgi:hypothetical protein
MLSFKIKFYLLAISIIFKQQIIRLTIPSSKLCPMKTTKHTTLLTPRLLGLLLTLFLLHTGCDKSQNEPVITTPGFTITVGAFSESNGVYTALGNELIFDSSEECQTWSRTAQADIHNSATHLHYNAAANISYNHTDTIFRWISN